MAQRIITAREILHAVYGAWHSRKSGVYHIDPDCTVGNNIEQENWQSGHGNRSLCRQCRRLQRAA